MIFAASITIPKQTTQENEIQNELKLFPCTIKNIKIHFPSGHAGLTHIRFFVNEIQIHPVIRDTFFIGDDTFIDSDVGIEISDSSAILKTRAWSEDDIYEHTIYYYVDIVVKALTLIEFQQITGQI